MLGDPLQLQLLQMVCKMIGAKKALDIGKQGISTHGDRVSMAAIM